MPDPGVPEPDWIGTPSPAIWSQNLLELAITESPRGCMWRLCSWICSGADGIGAGREDLPVSIYFKLLLI